MHNTKIAFKIYGCFFCKIVVYCLVSLHLVGIVGRLKWKLNDQTLRLNCCSKENIERKQIASFSEIFLSKLPIIYFDTIK